MSVSIPIAWSEIDAFADLVATFYSRNKRDPDDREIEKLVATAKDIAASGATGVH